jgi:predicted DCC family thiol-disulfide oxidoreductase YuxK
MTPNHPIVFFDGVCNLCNASVQWLIKRDQKHQFRFAPLQGETAKLHLKITDENAIPQSVILFENGKVYQKSTAALRLAVKLGFPWFLAGIFFIIPRFLRDWVYDYIARNRYRWFGKKDACMIPTPELKALFLN